ncbi:MAG: SIMPL domain-containing protein [Candidatus Uhrbacteria bacterium]
MTIWPKWKEDRVYAVAILVLILSSIIYLGAKTINVNKQSKEIGQPQPYEHTITIDGEGKVTGKPDIATVTMGTESKGADVVSAQTANNETMDKIIAELKAMNISADDIQTSSYNVYEDIQWNAETNTSESKGWIVSNYVTVKVRDTAKLPNVLAMAGENGITNISGPTFTIDDPTNLKNEARVEAIAQAQKKAREVATSLGLRVESVVGYSEWAPSNDYAYFNDSLALKSAAPMPSIESGTNEVVLDVSITYKLME